MQRGSFARSGISATALVWPEGLEASSFTCRLTPAEADFEAVFEAFKESPGFHTRSDNKAIRGVLKGSPSRHWHAHFEMTHVSARRGSTLEFQTVRGPCGRQRPGTLTSSAFLRRLKALLPAIAGMAQPGMLSARFELSMDRWKTTMPIPYAASGLADLPGEPEIAGLDFAFQDTPVRPGMRRAFITTYSELKQIVVRLLLAGPRIIDESLPRELLSAGTQHLSMFAVSRAQGD